VTLLAALAAGLVLLGAVLDLMVSAATAVAKLTLGAISHCMAHIATIEAPLLAWWALLFAFLLLLGAAHFCNVALLSTL